MKKSTGRLIAVTAAVLLIAYLLSQKSEQRTKKEELQKLIDILKELDSDNEELIALQQRLEAIKDSLSEMSETEMFYLHQLMQMRSQLEQMLSNLMKAVNEVQSAIIANLKG